MLSSLFILIYNIQKGLAIVAKSSQESKTTRILFEIFHESEAKHQFSNGCLNKYQTVIIFVVVNYRVSLL